MGTIKDRNVMDLTEADDIKKRWQEYIEELCKKSEWLSEEALQIVVKTREVNSKGEKERYKHLNAEFQRIARRDKKPSSDVQAGFRKGRGTRDQITNILWIIEKAREFQKKSTTASLTMPKPST